MCLGLSEKRFFLNLATTKCIGNCSCWPLMWNHTPVQNEGCCPSKFTLATWRFLCSYILAGKLLVAFSHIPISRMVRFTLMSRRILQPFCPSIHPSHNSSVGVLCLLQGAGRLCQWICCWCPRVIVCSVPTCWTGIAFPEIPFPSGSGLELARRGICTRCRRQERSSRHYFPKVIVLGCGEGRGGGDSRSLLVLTLLGSVPIFFPPCWPCWPTAALGPPLDICAAPAGFLLHFGSWMCWASDCQVGIFSQPTPHWTSLQQPARSIPKIHPFLHSSKRPCFPYWTGTAKLIFPNDARTVRREPSAWQGV